MFIGKKLRLEAGSSDVWLGSILKAQVPSNSIFDIVVFLAVDLLEGELIAGPSVLKKLFDISELTLTLSTRLQLET